MYKKRGVTLTVLAVAIAVMLIIITSSTFIGMQYINEAKLDGFKTMIWSVTDSVNSYKLKNGKLPITNESIVYTNYTSDFANEVEEKGDALNKLYIVDISKLENYSITEGKGNVSNGDIFVVAENTNNIYYLRGYKYRGKLYYGI